MIAINGVLGLTVSNKPRTPDYVAGCGQLVALVRANRLAAQPAQDINGASEARWANVSGQMGIHEKIFLVIQNRLCGGTNVEEAKSFCGLLLRTSPCR